MGCAASTQDDNDVVVQQRRGAVPAPSSRTAPAASANTPRPAATVAVMGSVSSPSAAPDETPLPPMDTPRSSSEDNDAAASPSQIRLAAKKQVSPNNGRTVCSLALVDALPRYTAPLQPSPRKITVCEERQSCGATQSAADVALSHQSLLAPIRPSSQNNSAGSHSAPHHATDCSICLMPMPGSIVVAMACLHTFHYHCAKEWLSQHDGSCPDCRTKVCVENFSYPNEVEGDAELARNAQNEEDMMLVTADNANPVVGRTLHQELESEEETVSAPVIRAMNVVTVAA